MGADRQGNIRRQRELYGASIGELTRQVTKELGLSQGAVARLLGVSGPMLSQLVSGSRFQARDPAVVQRLLLVCDVAAQKHTLTQSQVSMRLAEIAESQLTLVTARDLEEDTRAAALAELRRLATPGQLAEAAGLLVQGGASSAVAGLLSQAAAPPPAPLNT